ncbi:hypothetical protein C1N59_17390 [Pantoea sp. SGAir0183]
MRVCEQRILLRSGNGMVQISGNQPFRLTTRGPAQHCEARLAGKETCWLIRLNDDPQLSTLEEFDSRFAQLSIEQREDGTICVNDPIYGDVFFQPNGCVFGQGRLRDPDSGTLAGESPELELPSGAHA